MGKEDQRLNGSTLKERGISLLVSLAFHAILMIFLVKVIPPVRGYLYRNVADVRIMSPEAVFIPRIYGLTEDTQATGASSPDPPIEDTSVQASAGESQADPDPGIVYLRNLGIGRSMAGIRDRMDPTEMIPRFDLVPSPKSEGGFSLRIERRKTESEEIAGKDGGKDLNFLRYQNSALDSLRFDQVISRNPKSSPTGQFSQAGIGLPEGYDLTPWVREVVDKIRDNWILPPIDESIALGEVKIFITIGEEGNLLAMGIVAPSDFPVFDQTTLQAIRSSVPFPRLPDDFPTDRIEAYLVFQFHE